LEISSWFQIDTPAISVNDFETEFADSIILCYEETMGYWVLYNQQKSGNQTANWLTLQQKNPIE